MFPGSTRNMILLVCCIYSATAAIRHLGKLGVNPSLSPGSTEWRIGPGTHSPLPADSVDPTFKRGLNPTISYHLHCYPLITFFWTCFISQLVVLLLPLILFRLFATQQLGNPEVRSQHNSIANPTYLRVKGSVFTMAHKAVHDMTPFYPVSS